MRKFEDLYLSQICRFEAECNFDVLKRRFQTTTQKAVVDLKEVLLDVIEATFFNSSNIP